MVVIRGVNVHPSAFEEIVRRFPEIVEYRVEVISLKSLTEIYLEIEPSPDCREAARLAQEVESALRTAFNLRVPTRIVPCGALPRFELKARRWTRRADS